MPLRVRHYELAEHLVDVHGLSIGLRTLDSLHLAIALDLRQIKLIDSIIAGDKGLCRVAPLEQLVAINPEETTSLNRTTDESTRLFLPSRVSRFCSAAQIEYTNAL